MWACLVKTATGVHLGCDTKCLYPPSHSTEEGGYWAEGRGRMHLKPCDFDVQGALG